MIYPLAIGAREIYINCYNLRNWIFCLNLSRHLVRIIHLKQALLTLFSPSFLCFPSFFLVHTIKHQKV